MNATIADIDLSAVVAGYLETAVFADTPEGYLPTAHYREGDISTARFTKAARARATADCTAFIAACGDDATAMTPWDMGSNFWYTRNGHGVGFWDRGLEDVGERLTAICKQFGGCDLEVYRGRIYLH